jgi:hypothetical protein
MTRCGGSEGRFRIIAGEPPTNLQFVPARGKLKNL